MPVSVWPASSRSTTALHGITTRHSFSFGAHYDPDNIGFGSIVAFNDERLPVGTGYDEHPHADLEIVTLVLSGALRHTSSVGSGELGALEVQRLTAGSGVVHSEVNAAGSSTRFLQTWIRPDSPGLTPSYASAGAMATGGLTCVAGGDGLSLNSVGTSLHVGRVSDPVTLPDAPLLHVFVAAGSGTLGDRSLAPDDAARLVDQGGRTFTPTSEDTLLVVWALSR